MINSESTPPPSTQSTVIKNRENESYSYYSNFTENDVILNEKLSVII